MAKTLAKTELLELTHTARAAWDERFAAIPSDQLETPGAAGYWSAKDVQAHLTTNNRWITGQLRAMLRGEKPTAEECYGHNETPPPSTNLADQDQRNAWNYGIDKERPLDEVLAMALEYADALEAAIAAVPEDAFAQPYTFGDHAHIAQIRPARDGEFAIPLAAIIASYGNEHYDAHTADLRAAFERELYGRSA
jgi:hypothetical protein